MDKHALQEFWAAQYPFFRAWRASGHIEGKHPASRGYFVRAPDSQAIYHISSTHWTNILRGKEGNKIITTNGKTLEYEPSIEVPAGIVIPQYDIAVRKIKPEDYWKIPDVLTIAEDYQSGEIGFIVGNDERLHKDAIPAKVKNIVPKEIRDEVWTYAMPVKVRLGKQEGTLATIFRAVESEHWTGIYPGHSGNAIVNQNSEVITFLTTTGFGETQPQDLRKLLSALGDGIDQSRVKSMAQDIHEKLPGITDKVLDLDKLEEGHLEAIQTADPSVEDVLTFIDYARKAQALGYYGGYTRDSEYGFLPLRRINEQNIMTESFIQPAVEFLRREKVSEDKIQEVAKDRYVPDWYREETGRNIPTWEIFIDYFSAD